MNTEEIKEAFGRIRDLADDGQFNELKKIALRGSQVNDYQAAQYLDVLVKGERGAETPGVIMFMLGKRWQAFVDAVEADEQYKATKHKLKFKAVGDDPEAAEVKIRKTVEKFAGVKCAKTKIAEELGISTKTLNRYIKKIPDCEIK